MNKSFLLLVVVCILLLENSKGYGQHMPPYSLQPALESLHRRDAIAGHVPSQSQIDYNDEDVNEPNPSRNSKIDRLIAAYLAKDYLEDDDSEDGNYFLPEEKKKSYFRERDEKVDPP
uniref:Uncharacterized protein n=1 Tax=Megaselia scalaris TaxID=36166 RepID=T1GR23_MEGSC